MSAYPFIEAEKAESHDVAKACELLQQGKRLQLQRIEIERVSLRWHRL